MSSENDGGGGSDGGSGRKKNFKSGKSPGSDRKDGPKIGSRRGQDPKPTDSSPEGTTTFQPGKTPSDQNRRSDQGGPTAGGSDQRQSGWKKGQTPQGDRPDGPRIGENRPDPQPPQPAAGPEDDQPAAADDPPDNGDGTAGGDGGAGDGAGGQQGQSSMSLGVSINAEYNRKFGFDASGAAKIQAKLVALPPPSLLLKAIGAGADFIDETRNRADAARGGMMPKPDELPPEEQVWVDFGARWLSVVEPINTELEALRQKHLSSEADNASTVATILATIKDTLKRFPASSSAVANMRKFLDAKDVKAAEDDPLADAPIAIRSPLLALLDDAP